MQVRKTKRFSFLSKKIISSVIAAVFTAAFCVYAADASKWTLAAEQFTYKKNRTNSAAVASSKTMPQLILEQMAQNLTRMPRAQEQLDRKIYDFRKNRLDLFLQLSKEVQVRDSLLLNSYSQKTLDSKIKAEDKKIAELEKKIADNLADEKKCTEEYRPRLESEKKRQEQLEKGEGESEETDDDKPNMADFLKGFIPGKKEEFKLEDVVLYQNDYTKLFDAGEEKRRDGYDSYAFEKACVDAKINGLVTGKITMYGSYLSVAVTLYLYPGAKAAASAIEVGSVDELRGIAVSLANQLTPKIADSMPVEVSFSVGPEEAAEDAVITIDDIVYREVPENLIMHSGVHAISVSSKGYTSLNTSYAFKGARKFEVSIQMEKNNPGQSGLYLKNPAEGNIFANGIYSSKIDDINRSSQITINNKNVLGHFVGTDGKSADFIINAKNMELEKNLIVNARIFDKSKNIDKRRRWMYGSYSGLICSLIPYFVCYGNTQSLAAFYKTSAGKTTETYNKAQAWNTMSNISMGVAIGAGTFFVIELVRYLFAANDVLPAEAKPVTEKQQALIDKQIELARQKQAENEQAAVTESEKTENEKIESDQVKTEDTEDTENKE